MIKTLSVLFFVCSAMFGVVERASREGGVDPVLTAGLLSCAGCDLIPHQSAGLPVDVAIDFGPLSFAGSCTGEQEPCSSSPCFLQTLVYYVSNPGGAGVDLTIYSGSFPTLTGTRLTLSANSEIRVEVGKSTDPETRPECGSYKVLVTVGLEDAGVQCTKCPS